MAHWRLEGGGADEEGIRGVELGCWLRRVGVRVEMKYLKNQTATL